MAKVKIPQLQQRALDPSDQQPFKQHLSLYIICKPEQGHLVEIMHALELNP